jgi:hypothetical protein
MSTIKSSSEDLTLDADGGSSEIKLKINNVEKASISSAGAFTSTTIDATALTGNLPAISGASLTGLPAASAVAFPATQVASANANTLDDYEEGLWTPIANGGSSYTNQVGWYVKIGRYVYIEFYIRGFTSTAVSSIITGLPFTAGSASPSAYSYGASFTTHDTWTNCSGGGGYIKHTFSEIKFHNVGSLAVSTATGANPAYCMGFGSYHTDD